MPYRLAPAHTASRLLATSGSSSAMQRATLPDCRSTVWRSSCKRCKTIVWPALLIETLSNAEAKATRHDPALRSPAALCVPDCHSWRMGDANDLAGYSSQRKVFAGRPFTPGIAAKMPPA